MTLAKPRLRRTVAWICVAGLRLVLALFLAVSLLSPSFARLEAAAFGKPQTHAKRKPPAAAAPTHLPPDASVPFQSGERLSYRVLWSKYSVNAATIEFQTIARANFFGHAAWHFRALAHTVDTMRFVYALDDQFDSYTDSGHLTSVEYEMYLREQGKQQNNAWRMTADGGPAPPDAAAAQVVPGTDDPIGLIYALRAADWKKTPELHAPVFDGHHLYTVVARIEDAPGQVTVPAGQFMGTRISVRISEHGQELTDMHFSLWLGQDAARTPLLIEADVPIGTARVELTSKL